MSVAAPGFFVVGDAKPGASLIVWAIAERRKTVPRRTSTSWVGVCCPDRRRASAKIWQRKPARYWLDPELQPGVWGFVAGALRPAARKVSVRARMSPAPYGGPSATRSIAGTPGVWRVRVRGVR